MTKSYVQLKKEIAGLEAQALKLKQAEAAGVVLKVKEAIESYGLTVEELFGPRSVTSKRGRVTAKTKSKKPDVAKYVDGNGNAWVGRGPRPQWLRDALAAGKPLSDFEVGANPKGGRVAPSRKAAAKRGSAGRVKAAGRTKYKDEAGNAWTGVGKRPNWFKDALANGKSAEDLLA